MATKSLVRFLKGLDAALDDWRGVVLLLVILSGQVYGVYWGFFAPATFAQAGGRGIVGIFSLFMLLVPVEVFCGELRAWRHRRQRLKSL